MCLLITGPSNAVRSTLLDTVGLLADIYKSNPDGLGVMHHSDGGLYVHKTLPSSPEDVVEFIATLPQDDRDVALHFRWRTHGDINLEQCHPYVVNATTALMHNGILHTGNEQDVSKSDTWHFIQTYLHTLPVDALHSPQFHAMLEEFIDSNRFAIMSSDGRLSVINRSQGVTYNGVWFSNTYAWTPSLLIPTYAKPAKWYDSDSWGSMDAAPSRGWAASSIKDWGLTGGSPYDEEDSPTEMPEDLYEMIELAVSQYDVPLLTSLLEEEPDDTLDYIFDNYDVSVYHAKTKRTKKVEALMKKFVAKDVHFFKRILAFDTTGSDATTIAEVVLYECTLDLKEFAA